MRCPRCDGDLAPTDGPATCEHHGEVTPVGPLLEPSVEALLEQATAVATPTWLPWPLEPGWSVSGLTRAEGRATLVATAGPSLLEEVAEMVVVCEEPAVGLGARVAGVTDADVAVLVGSGPADAHVDLDGRRTPLWRVRADGERESFVGEAAGRWLWIVCLPGSTALLLADLALRPLAEMTGELGWVPLSAPTERLRGL